MNYSLYLVDDCDLNCSYCYEKNSHSNRVLSFENIKKIIDYEVYGLVNTDKLVKIYYDDNYITMEEYNKIKKDEIHQ